MRLGQCRCELGDLRQAGEELCRAHTGAGTEMFANDAPKYLAYVKSVLPPAEGQWQGGVDQSPLSRRPLLADSSHWVSGAEDGLVLVSSCDPAGTSDRVNDGVAVMT